VEQPIKFNAAANLKTAETAWAHDFYFARVEEALRKNRVDRGSQS